MDKPRQSLIIPFRKPLPDQCPPYFYKPYGSTVKRAPQKAPVMLQQTLTEVTGPGFQMDHPKPMVDLTASTTGEPIGERIIVAGKVMDENQKPMTNVLVEVWQANAAGRYMHDKDNHQAPLDPNFKGSGQMITDKDGNYSFTTIRPGAYPWRNHDNAWRPAHIHFSVFGYAFANRLITQMYFPNDPLLAYDPIFNSIAEEKARNRLICAFDMEATIPEFALAYRFDIILRGRDETPMENK